MIKKFKILLLILIFTIPLTGCWDFEDINKKSFIFSVGVDKLDNKIVLSGESTEFTSTKIHEKAEKQENFFQYLGSGSNFEEARLNIEQEVSDDFFLGETKTVIFGRQLAEEGLESYLNRIDSSYDYKKTLIPVISKEPAKELLSYKLDRNLTVGSFIEDNITNLIKKSNAIYTSLNDINSIINVYGTGFFMPYLGIEKGSIRYLGLAVIKDSKFIDFIKIEDTDGILHLLHKRPRLVEEIYLPKDINQKYIFDTSTTKRSIKTDYKDEQIIININLSLDASLLYQYYLKPIDNKKIKLLENKISEKVKKDILKNIEDSQKKYKCDTFNFHKYFNAQNPKIYQKINWGKKYPEAKINVNIKTKMINKSLKDPNSKK